MSHSRHANETKGRNDTVHFSSCVERFSLGGSAGPCFLHRTEME